MLEVLQVLEAQWSKKHSPSKVRILKDNTHFDV